MPLKASERPTVVPLGGLSPTARGLDLFHRLHDSLWDGLRSQQGC